MRQWIQWWNPEAHLDRPDLRTYPYCPTLFVGMDFFQRISNASRQPCRSCGPYTFDFKNTKPSLRKLLFICLSFLGKNEHISSSHRFPLKPTGETKYILSQLEASEKSSGETLRPKGNESAFWQVLGLEAGSRPKS